MDNNTKTPNQAYAPTVHHTNTIMPGSEHRAGGLNGRTHPDISTTNRNNHRNLRSITEKVRGRPERPSGRPAGVEGGKQKKKKKCKRQPPLVDTIKTHPRPILCTDLHCGKAQEGNDKAGMPAVLDNQTEEEVQATQHPEQFHGQPNDQDGGANGRYHKSEDNNTSPGIHPAAQTIPAGGANDDDTVEIMHQSSQEQDGDPKGRRRGAGASLQQPRPGAYAVYPGNQAPPPESHQDLWDEDMETELSSTPQPLPPQSRQSTMMVDGAEVYTEETNNLRRLEAIQKSQEEGRQEGLRQLAASAVRAVPMTADPRSETHPSRHKFFHSAFILMCLGFVVVVVAIVVPVTVVKVNDKSASYSNSNGGSSIPAPQVTCFQNESILQAAVDAYLQPPSNSTYNHMYGPVYGPSISYWCVSKIQIFDNLFNATRNPQSQLFDADLSGWDVSNATSMAGMFAGAGLFVGLGVGKWNVSQVTNMSETFEGAWSFDSNLSQWDVSRVTTMYAMFKGAAAFRGLGVDQWNVSRVNDTESMLEGASMFNADLAHWDVSQVTTMRNMFYMASSFTGAGVDLWNVTHVMDMAGMFWAEPNLDANLSTWDVSNVIDMSSMFSDSPRFRGVGLEQWDVKRVTATDSMLAQAWAFDANLSNWNTSQVETMTYMFTNASSFRGVGLENWDVSRVTSFEGMFWVATKFDANLSGWDVSRVYDFDNMFGNAESFRGIGLEQWNTSNATDIGAMFYGAFNFDANLSMWDVSKVIYMWDVFGLTKSFRGTGLEKWNVGNVEDIDTMFDRSELFDADLSEWNVSQVAFAQQMFQGAQRFRGVGVDKWDVSNVISMSNMFDSALLFDADLSMWQVSNVKRMSHMFINATSFTGRGLEKWNVSSTIYAIGMFEGAVRFNTSLCSWGKVLPLSVNATQMFAGTSCLVTASPNMNLTTPGPFCYPC